MKTNIYNNLSISCIGSELCNKNFRNDSMLVATATTEGLSIKEEVSILRFRKKNNKTRNRMNNFIGHLSNGSDQRTLAPLSHSANIA